MAAGAEAPKQQQGFGGNDCSKHRLGICTHSLQRLSPKQNIQKQRQSLHHGPEPPVHALLSSFCPQVWASRCPLPPLQSYQPSRAPGRTRPTRAFAYTLPWPQLSPHSHFSDRPFVQDQTPPPATTPAPHSTSSALLCTPPASGLCFYLQQNRYTACWLTGFPSSSADPR